MVLREGGLADDAKAVGEARSRMMKTKLLSLSLFLSVRTERRRERERDCVIKSICSAPVEEREKGREGG